MEYFIIQMANIIKFMNLEDWELLILLDIKEKAKFMII